MALQPAAAHHRKQKTTLLIDGTPWENGHSGRQTLGKHAKRDATQERASKCLGGAAFADKEPGTVNNDCATGTTGVAYVC